MNISMYTQWDESDRKLFKDWLKSHLTYGKVTVKFTKKDGTERVMNCTTNSDLVPLVEEKVTKTNTDNTVDLPKVKKINEEVCFVFDMDKNAWRSFRFDTVTEVRLDLG